MVIPIQVIYSQEKGELIEQTLDAYIPFTIIQYSTKNGLPQNQVIDIIADEKGELILSTANGIVRFNGHEFKTFIKGIDYKSNRFKKLFWHAKSGTLSGLEYDGSFFSIFPYFKNISGSVINDEQVCDATISNNTLWLYTKRGSIYEYKYGDKRIKKIISLPCFWSNSMLCVYPKLYCATEKGIIQVDVENKTYYNIAPDLQLQLIKKNPFNNKIYGMSYTKVFVITPKLEEIFDIQIKNSQKYCEDMEFSGPESIFLATSNGLFLIEPEYPEHFTKADGLPSNHCYSLYYDKQENCLFIGTGQKGLLKLQLKSAYSFSSGQGLTEASLSSIIQTYDKRVLISGNCCEIYQIRPDTVMQFSNVTASYSCLAEVDNIVYAGTWGDGVKLIRNKELYSQIKMPQLPNNFVHSTFKDSKNNIWIGTSNGVSIGRDHKNFKPFLTDKIKGLIISIAELKNGNICIGGSEGVYIIRDGVLINSIGRKDGFIGKEVRSFYEDKEGKLWIGAYDGGIYCYHQNKLTSINKMSGCMMDNDAFCLAPDNFGYLLISSNHGLWRVDLNDLNDFYYGKINYLIPFKYDQENGILNPEFNGGFQNNFLKTSIGHFYFPTIEGAVMFDPEDIKFRKIFPSINKVVVNDTLSALGRHSFGRKTYSIQFEFSCINFLNKYNVYYQHKLDGEKKTDWSTPQKSNIVHLKMLPPGKYTFMVRAIDGFNDNSPATATYEFEIEPYAHETPFFRLIVFFFFISIVTIVIAERIYNIRKKAEKKELAKRQLAEFELKAIQAQMSPHFIFNCLNSIKYFVVSGKTNEAEKLLDHFSLLIRKFLENSELVEVPVHEEAAMLLEYLSVEQMRMNHTIQFKVEVEKGCEHIKIPTMLTQPYVENAIKHGVAHLKRIGNIHVSFKRLDDQLICTIDDDGIGRKKGMEISEQNRKHIPKGMGLVSEKSKILKALYNKKIRITFEDKEDENQQPLGTRVIISIPM